MAARAQVYIAEIQERYAQQLIPEKFLSRSENAGTCNRPFGFSFGISVHISTPSIDKTNRTYYLLRRIENLLITP